ncbi:Protein unc-45-like protein [Sarcoptes scabiei]|nr:Protein unc-45-like protein [Sarcoptes scabiei]
MTKSIRKPLISDPLALNPKSVQLLESFNTDEKFIDFNVFGKNIDRIQKIRLKKDLRQSKNVSGFIIPKINLGGNEKIEIASQGDPSLLEFVYNGILTKTISEDFIGSASQISQQSTLISQNPARIPSVQRKLFSHFKRNRLMNNSLLKDNGPKKKSLGTKYDGLQKLLEKINSLSKQEPKLLSPKFCHSHPPIRIRHHSQSLSTDKKDRKLSKQQLQLKKVTKKTTSQRSIQKSVSRRGLGRGGSVGGAKSNLGIHKKSKRPYKRASSSSSSTSKTKN